MECIARLWKTEEKGAPHGYVSSEQYMVKPFEKKTVYIAKSREQKAQNFL
jgi:hypothetical protein